jgi:hypothetical protein
MCFFSIASQFQFPREVFNDMFLFVAWNETVPIIQPVFTLFFVLISLLTDVKLPVLMKPFLEIIYAFG